MRVRWRRGCKFQRNKLSTLASSQEQVLSNQTMNKHPARSVTHCPSQTCLFCQYLAPLELCAGGKTQQAKATLLKVLITFFLFVHITEKCVPLSALITFVSQDLGCCQGSADWNLMNSPPLLIPLSHSSLVIHPLGCNTSLLSPHHLYTFNYLPAFSFSHWSQLFSTVNPSLHRMHLLAHRFY